MAASYTNGPFHIQALQSRRSMLYGDMDSREYQNMIVKSIYYSK